MCQSQCVAQPLKNGPVISWCLSSTLSKLARQTVAAKPRLGHEAASKGTKLTSPAGQIKVTVFRTADRR